MSKRIKFFLSHLIISLLIALIIVGVVFLIWYPTPLGKAVGLTEVFVMLITIDIIIGPLLSLLIYKEDKKNLKIDLSMIIFIQISALIYGVYSIEQGRPVWIVYNVDRFELVRANDLVVDNIDNIPQEYRRKSWFKPKFVGVEFSKDRATRNNDLFKEVTEGVSIAQNPERYIAINKVKKTMQNKAQSLSLLEQYNDKNTVKEILMKFPEANAYVPLKSNIVDMTVLINKEKGSVIEVVDLRPWK